MTRNYYEPPDQADYSSQRNKPERDPHHGRPVLWSRAEQRYLMRTKIEAWEAVGLDDEWRRACAALSVAIFLSAMADGEPFATRPRALTQSERKESAA